jgi:dolichyl-phosphate beta-glucosyltransferase
MNHLLTEQRSISVVIPAYTEASRLTQTLTVVTTYLNQTGADWQLILVDDGSVDPTHARAEEFVRAHGRRVRILHNSVNRGKGAAVKRGVLAATNELILFMDADQATPIEALPTFVAAIGSAGVVIGSRYRQGATFSRRQGLVRRALSRVGNWLIRRSLDLPYTDTQCGYKLFTAAAARTMFPRLTIDRWGFDIELLVIARAQGIPVVEVPVVWHDGAESKLNTGRAAWQTLRELGQIWRNLKRGQYD